MPCGFPMTSSLLLDYHVKHYTRSHTSRCECMSSITWNLEYWCTTTLLFVFRMGRGATEGVDRLWSSRWCRRYWWRCLRERDNERDEQQRLEVNADRRRRESFIIINLSSYKLSYCNLDYQWGLCCDSPIFIIHVVIQQQ